MFGSIGFTELILIAGVALMVLGPEKFPEFAKMAARFVKDIRSYANEIQREVAKEIKPMTKELQDLRKIDPEKYLDKLTGGDEEDEKLNNTPPNPEPHPSEMGFGEPAAPAAETSKVSEGGSEATTASETDQSAGGYEQPETVSYGDGGEDPYPREDDVPPSAKRLDG